MITSEQAQKLSLVFIFKKVDGEYKILLGKKNKPGKPIHGRYNGLGGKCEAGENVEDCAVREVAEEARVKISKEQLKKVGQITNQNMFVDVFIYIAGEYEDINPISSGEQDMQNFSWFSETDTNSLVKEGYTIQGNDSVYKGVWLNLSRLIRGEPINEFVLDKSHNEAGNLFRQSMK